MKLSTKFLPLLLAALFMTSCDKNETLGEDPIADSVGQKEWAPTYEIGHVLTKQEAIDAGIDVSEYYDNWNPIEAEALPEGVERMTDRSAGWHQLKGQLSSPRTLYWYQVNSGGSLVYVYNGSGSVHQMDVPKNTWYNCIFSGYIPVNRWEIVNPANSSFTINLSFYDDLQSCWTTPTSAGVLTTWNDDIAVFPGGLTATCNVQRVWASGGCP